MQLNDLVKSFSPSFEFDKYIRTASKRGQPSSVPPLSTRDLRLQALVGTERDVIKTATDGDVSLLLSYKGHEASVSSIQETDPEFWRIVQVQGAVSKKIVQSSFYFPLAGIFCP